MVSVSLAILKDLCCIHIAYLLWTRRVVSDHNRGVNNIFDERESAALADAQELPLPEELKSLVVKHVKPTGGRLLSLLKLWLSKLPKSDASEECLTFDMFYDMLFDCLILNGDGLINQRRTAQALLHNKVVHNVLAFRLACINFLQTEVLKLWILVKEHFLNKIVREGNRPDTFQSYLYEILEDAVDDYYKRTAEPVEVLFWVWYCLSKENAVAPREVAHFMISEFDWYEFALDSAVASGNVACFDYFKNFSDGTFKYNYVDILRIRILRSAEENCQHSCFIFHFMFLNFEEKSELFQEFPREMVNQFLQWPLSQTFLQNKEEVWNLLPDVYKHWVFSEVYNALNFENFIFHNGYIPHFFQSSPTYCEEHLLEIWPALWNISPNNYKSAFLDLRLFPDFEDLHEDKFPLRFETSGMKQKLLNLFLSNGGALLELYQRATLQESLRNIITKYMPADLQNLERRYISFFETLRIPLTMFVKNKGDEVIFPIFCQRGSRVNGRYIDYIKTFVFVSNGSKETFSHY